MNENGAVWKSDYPKKHVYILGTAELLIGLAIIALEATMVTYKEDFRLNDIRYNPLLPIAITGLVFGLYFFVLALVTGCTAKSRSRCMTLTFLIMSFIALAMDLLLLSYHGLHLITRCNPNEFEGVSFFLIRNCRNEFDHVLLIVRHGAALLMVIIAITLHCVVNFSSIIIGFYVLCRVEQTALTTYHACVSGNAIPARDGSIIHKPNTIFHKCCMLVRFLFQFRFFFSGRRRSAYTRVITIMYWVFRALTDPNTKWLVKLMALLGSLFVFGMVIFQAIFLSDFKKLQGPYDSEDYSILGDAITNILLTIIYSLVLGAMTLWMYRSEKLFTVAIVCTVSFFCLFAVDLPMVLFYPLKLMSKCGIDSFHNIILNCQPDLNTLLGLIMEGSTPIVVGLIGVFHLIHLIGCFALAIAKCKNRKRGSYEVQRR